MGKAGQATPQPALRPCSQGMRSNWYHARATPSVAANLTALHEEVDTPQGLRHARGAFGQPSWATEPLLKLAKRGIAE